ncbi:FERM domain-containing protein 6 isoform X1 [Brachyhypopomus gauderio]|uniref:FERM domain-containing protein 6 isoform X1 n=1 Tax=Brachyhypopomus gauderio TaxID=698409 RepID=UPI0040433B46
MSVSAKHERTVCVLLPSKETLDITVGLKATGKEVLKHVSALLGVKELYFFGLTTVKDNEHMFLDLEEKLAKYFPKEWKRDAEKGSQKRWLPPLLFLKVQYYVENGRLICEQKVRRLYYADLRERVLRSECRQQEVVYFQLAGYALQADRGDRPPQDLAHGGASYFQPKDYFPPWIVARRGVEYLLRHTPEIHQELWGMSSRDATLIFIREACGLEDVPVTIYRLQKDKRDESTSVLLGLTLQGMHIYQEMNNVRELLYDFPWSHVGRLTFLGKRFEIQPDGLPSARKLVYYTGSAFRSRHLLLHLTGSHRLHLSLQPALRYLRRLEEAEEKKRYRESYISDDAEPETPYTDSSPRLSCHSTCSSGIEADTQRGGVSAQMLPGGEQPFGSTASRGSSHTSGIDMGGKARNEEDEWAEEELQEHVIEPGEVSVDDPEEMLRLAELLEGVSVDSPSLSSDFSSTGTDFNLGHVTDGEAKASDWDRVEQVLKWRSHGLTERHSLSLDKMPLRSPPPHAGPVRLLSMSGLPDGPGGAELASGPVRPSFYGRRSVNCLALDLLGDEQLMELLL